MAKRMDPRVKEMWLKALRSGEYKQAKGFLNIRTEYTDTYCCLGVLCDLWSKEVPDAPDWNHAHDNGGIGIIDNVSSVLPLSVMKWAGLCRDSTTGYDHKVSLDIPVEVPRTPGKPAQNLVAANDGGLKFDQIADIIEAQL